ncbi:MAG TPA: amidohydrolase [Steroidobacteraceae bacterium]|nr:amidohydrolase [Steroidobacteraceae bacterium]
MTSNAKRSIHRTIALGLAIAALAACGRGNGADDAADLALTGGRIYTVDADRSWAEAVAVRDGRIVFVGSNEDARAHIGKDTQVVDLAGRMVVPGFQDVHVHPISAGVEANACNLNGLDGVDAYVAAIKKYADENPDEPWITGGGWLMSDFGPGALARKELIDAVVPDRPVILWSTDGHTVWVNTKALEIAGITRETADPPDGRIDRDPKTGAPIGSLQEGAGSLVASKMPPTSDEQRMEGLRYAVKYLNGLGITAVQDASVNEENLGTYRKLDDGGELSLHVVGSIWWERDKGLEQIEDIKRLRAEFTKGHVDAGTVKIMQDGVMENYTAVVLEPYILPGGKKEYGIPMVEPEKLKQAVTQLDADGFQVHFHAIGDGAVRQSLDAVEAARKTNGDLGHRHHISHLQLIHPDDVPRFRELSVVANFQPLWAYADPYITDLTLPFMTPERAQWLYPIGSVQTSGAVVAFGSDWSVSSPSPFEQMETAITRLGALGDSTEPLLAAESIQLPEAIAAFTINAAYVNRLEKETGSIEAGKRADLAVLDRNLFDIPPAELSDTKVLVTLFEGKAVHGKLEEL